MVLYKYREKWTVTGNGRVDLSTPQTLVRDGRRRRDRRWNIIIKFDKITNGNTEIENTNSKIET